MNETMHLAEAIACAALAGIAGAILWRARALRIGAILRLSLGLIVASGVILFGTRLKLAGLIDGISVEWVQFARVAAPIAASVVVWQLHRLLVSMRRST